MTKNKFDKPIKKCSFCGKTEDEVKLLIAGPSVNICDECTALCSDLVSNNVVEELDNVELENLPTPKNIKEYLDEHVIGQDNAKKYLSVAVYNHYKRVLGSDKEDTVNVQKSNILMVGPTGSGKTLLVKSLATYLQVPFAEGDATGMTEAGYVGDDITNVLTKLYQNADGDLEKVEKGIVYLDEIDKKRKQYGVNNRDVSGEGVQQALLKLIEGGTFDISVSNPRDKMLGDKKVTIDTKNILFVCGGAFVGLDNIVSKRISKNSMGFASHEVENKKVDAKDIDSLLAQVESEDLVKFGLIPEFLGRLPIITTLTSLKEEDLVSILTLPKHSLVNQFKESFKKDNHDLVFEDDALTAIAKIAIEKKTGARGLRSIMEKVLIDLMFDIPDNKHNENNEPVIVTKEFVEEKMMSVNNKQISV